MPATPPNFDSILAGIQNFGQRNGAVTQTSGIRNNIQGNPTGPIVFGSPGGPGNKGPTVTVGDGSGDGSSGSGSTAPNASSAISLGQIGSLIACFLSPTTCLLRLVMLILGIICVIGAIYLYKPTQQIIAAPARQLRDAVMAAGE